MRCTSIISAYYAPDWIEGRVTNLLEQTEIPKIVAVCQKGSEESKLLSKFPEVIQITTPDVPTVYKAWNLAIGAVDTPLINIANSDDRLINTAIEEMCDALQENPTYGLAYPDCHVVYEYNGEYVGELVAPDDTHLLSGCFIGPVPTYRRKLHELYGYFPDSYIVAGDYWQWLNFKSHGVEFMHIHKKLGIFYDRRHDPSVMNNIEYRKSNLTCWESARAREYWKARWKSE